MTEPLVQDVSDTAFMVATYRAMEGDRPTPLFRDPLAGRVAGEHGRQIVASLGRDAALGGWSVAIRTALIDDYLLAAVAEGVTLIVNLGAGLDTRPYRMALPEALQWIEVDFPKVIELKESALGAEQPRCRLERVKLDLADRGARQRLFAELGRRAERALVLTEGVVPYLSVEEVGSLAEDLRAQASFKLWIVDYFAPEMLKVRKRRTAKHLENAPWRFEPKDWLGFFGAHGWPLREIRYLPEVGERLGRPIPLPTTLKLLMQLRSVFMSRARREGLAKRFAGYAMLERPQ